MNRVKCHLQAVKLLHVFITCRNPRWSRSRTVKVAVRARGLFPVPHPRCFLTAVTDDEQLEEVIIVPRHGPRSARFPRTLRLSRNRNPPAPPLPAERHPYMSFNVSPGLFWAVCAASETHTHPSTLTADLMPLKQTPPTRPHDDACAQSTAVVRWILQQGAVKRRAVRHTSN